MVHLYTDLPSPLQGTQGISCCVVNSEGRLLGGDSSSKSACPKGNDADDLEIPSGSAPEAKPESRFSALKPFVIISVSYLLYTMTDGAIRMIVLLYAYNLGFSAW